MVVPQRAQAAPRVQGDQRLGFRVFWRGGHGVKHPTRRNSGRCVRILVSFSSLVYGIAAVSDGAVARRIQPAVVRVCGGGTSDRGVLFLPTLTSLFVFPLFFSLFSFAGISTHATCSTVRDGTTTTTATTLAATGTGFRSGIVPVEPIGATERTWRKRNRRRERQSSVEATKETTTKGQKGNFGLDSNDFM
tara:strand:- start:64 stop:636 length:573 start_codon:yes stop_codon:yes gene_type:complete